MLLMVRKRGVARRSFSHRRVRRVKKYDHNVIPRRFKIQLPDLAERLEPKLDVHVQCETPTMELLETLGVPSDEWQYYLGFMKRMIVIYQTFTADTLIKERDSLISEYVLRGKDEDVLEQVEEVAALCAEAEYEMDLWTRDFYLPVTFQDTAGFGLTASGAGGYQIFEGVLSLYTGGSATDVTTFSYWFNIPIGSLFSWSKNRKFRVAVRFETDSNQLIYVTSGGYSSGSDKYIGFKIVDNTIYGVVSDGVTERQTVALGTFSAGEIVLLEAQLTAGVECKFLVNEVEEGTLNANLPSGTENADALLSCFVQANADEVKWIAFRLWEFYQRR